MLTKREILEFYTQATQRFNIIATALGWYTGCDIEDMDEQGIRFHGEEYVCSCCSSEHRTYILPWEAILASDDEFPEMLEMMRQSDEIAKEADKRYKEHLAQQEAEKREAARRAEFERLKQEFESQN